MPAASKTTRQTSTSKAGAAKPAAKAAQVAPARSKASPAAKSVKPAKPAKAADKPRKAKPASKPVQAKAAKPKEKAPEPVASAPGSEILKPAKAKKQKLVRDSFTMPESEYALLGEVKKACLANGFAVKKSELLRVGVGLIRTLDNASLKKWVESLPPLKPGRPRKDKQAA